MITNLILATENGSIPIGELEVGEPIRTSDGSTGTVTSLAIVTESQDMWNLTVKEAHTFFVGDGEWLVHNTCTVFRSVDRNSDIVYRNPHHLELPTVEQIGFRPKNPTRDYRVGAHVRGNVDTQYISTSRSIHWTAYFQGQNYNDFGTRSPFYVIDLQHVDGQIIDLTDPAVLNVHIRPTDNARLKFVRQASEVLTWGDIPVNAIVARIDFDDDLVRYSTDLINRGLAEGWWSKGSSWYVP